MSSQIKQHEREHVREHEREHGYLRREQSMKEGGEGGETERTVSEVTAWHNKQKYALMND